MHCASINGTQAGKQARYRRQRTEWKELLNHLFYKKTQNSWSPLLTQEVALYPRVNQYVPFRIVRYHAHFAITSIYPLPFFFPFTVPPVFLPAGAPNKSSMLLALLIAVPGLDAGTLGGARAGPRFSPGGAVVAGLGGGGIGGVAET
jgi:hypothetical protein